MDREVPIKLCKELGEWAELRFMPWYMPLDGFFGRGSNKNCTACCGWLSPAPAKIFACAQQ